MTNWEKVDEVDETYPIEKYENSSTEGILQPAPPPLCLSVFDEIRTGKRYGKRIATTAKKRRLRVDATTRRRLPWIYGEAVPYARSLYNKGGNVSSAAALLSFFVVWYDCKTTNDFSVMTFY